MARALAALPFRGEGFCGLLSHDKRLEALAFETVGVA
jgi:hypothetical protein